VNRIVARNVLGTVMVDAPVGTGEDPMEQHMDHTTIGSAQPATATRLHGRWLLLARVAWLGVTALTLGLVIPAFIVAFDRPELLGAPEVEAWWRGLPSPCRP
jgi:hypothetical protein